MRNIRFAKFLLGLACLAMFVAACGAGETLPAQTVNMEPEILIEEPPAASLTEFDSLPTPLILPPTPGALPYPDWVSDFADPVLTRLVNRKPDFQDDFSLVCIYNSQWLDNCPTEDEMPNFIDDLSVRNQGWFYRIPGSDKGPFYADIQNGALYLRSPAGKDDRELMVYNPYLLHKNFVLSFDFQFGETEPGDIARFRFSQTAEQSVNLDLSKSKTWSFYNSSKTNSGVFSYFPPERMLVTFIMLGRECAVYLNNVPLDYLSDCRSAPIVGSFPWALSFHVVASSGHVATAAIDNVKLWNLDKIPGLQ